MDEFDEELEAGVENVKITLKTKLDLYVGMVYEDENILYVINRIDKCLIKDGMVSCDIIVRTLHKIR